MRVERKKVVAHDTASTQCPNCSVPIKIGQKICTNCGETLNTDQLIKQPLAKTQGIRSSTKSVSVPKRPKRTTPVPTRTSTPKPPIPTKKREEKPITPTKIGYWDKLDRMEIRRIRNYIFLIQIVLIVIILLNAIYESMLFEPFYLPLGYILLFILFLVFLLSIEGLWFKLVSIKNARSFKKRAKLIKDYRNSAQSALVIAIILLIVLLSLNFLPFVTEMLKTEDKFEFKYNEPETLASFEDQDALGLTHSNNLDFNSNNTVELKIHVRELKKDIETGKTEEMDLGNQTELDYSLNSPDFQLGYTNNKEYHFFILNAGNNNVSGKYIIQREISKPFLLNILLFMILFIITSICWLAYLNVNRKKYEKLYNDKVSEVTKRYAVKPYAIEDVFLIYKNGTLINHQTRRIKPMDNEILSGMLTAIKDFIRDVFKSDAKGELNELQFGKLKIMIEHGQFAFLAVVVSGTPPKELKGRMKHVMAQIHKQFYFELKNYNGDVRRLAPVAIIIQEQLLGVEDKDTQMDLKSDTSWNNKGVILTKLGKYNEALDCFDSALKLNPGVSDTWLNRGIALVKLNEYEEAMDCFDRALQLDPNNEFAKRRRNKCWYKWKLLEAREKRLGGGRRKRKEPGVARPMSKSDYPARPTPQMEVIGGRGVAKVGTSAPLYNKSGYNTSAGSYDAPVEEPPPRCPNCGQPLRFVEQFESWYCDPCDSYPFDD